LSPAEGYKDFLWDPDLIEKLHQHKIQLLVKYQLQVLDRPFLDKKPRIAKRGVLSGVLLSNLFNVSAEEIKQINSVLSAIKGDASLLVKKGIFSTSRDRAAETDQEQKMEVDEEKSASSRAPSLGSSMDELD
jgi:hypothetical protein